MLNRNQFKNRKNNFHSLYRKFYNFQASIFGRVILIIGLMSIILFLSFGFIFKTVYKNYLNGVLRQNGNNIGSVVEGALYRSMLKNDKTQLQSTLDLIKTMPGIDEVSLYDSKDELAYASFSYNTTVKGETQCKSCHPDIREMFPLKEKAYRIIDENSACNESIKGGGRFRQLMIRSPILNDQTCWISSCHAHNETQEVLGSLIIKMPLRQIDENMASSSGDFFMLAAISTFILVVVLVVFTRKKIKDPLNDIVLASEAVARGDNDMRLEIKPNLLNDLRVVSMAFNNMLDKISRANQELKEWSEHLEDKVQEKTKELLQIQGELIHVEKMTSLGKLSSSVAHEINNPLAGVLTFAKLVHKQLEDESPDEDTHEAVLDYLTIIEDETKRCGDIVKGLLDFSRKDSEDFQPAHLHDVLKYIQHLMDHQIRLSNIDFVIHTGATTDLIRCNENQIKQACVALLVNAMEAITGQGKIVIQTSNPDDNHIKLDISDTGCGIAEEHLKNIFEPFFSTKNKTNGVGLGLAIVHGITQNHNGKIEVSSRLMQGTTFSITLPLIKN